MVIKMFNGDPNFQGGVITGGGTESIIMALKAYRDWAREEKGIYSPNIIVPISAHAAFDKGSEYLGIEIVHAPLDPTTFSVDIKKLRKLINRNTIMIAGSVPNYPYGTTDDISLLSDIAIKKGIGLHVDCCLGSFVAAFMESSGYSLPPFDFRVPGVSSISCDTHKYGFAPKGSSIIMYRTKELRKYQFFVQPNWVGGIYVSPSFPGSRAGTIVAGCWAILMYFGKNGYIKSCKKIIETKLYIEEEIKKMDNLYILGKPPLSVLAFGTKDFEVYRITEEMSKKGWALSNLQNPPAIHLTLTHRFDGKEFITDLKDCISIIMENPNEKAKGSSAMYGIAAAIPDKSIVTDAIKIFLNTLYLTNETRTEVVIEEEKEEI